MTAVHHETLSLHGHEHSYWTGGDGPVVVLLHGMAGSAGTWTPTMSTLADHATVVAPDLLGHGSSAKPRGDYSLGAFANGVRDLLTALGHDRATVVGQSLGGGIALQFAYQFPERCERLVLVGSGGLGDEVSTLLRVLTLPGAEYVLPLACNSTFRDAGLAVGRFFGRFGLRGAPHAGEMWQAYSSLADAESRSAFVHTLRSVVDNAGQRVSARDRLHLASALPVLIVWGDHDPIIPFQHALDTHAALPDSRLEVFEGVGHFPHCEQPQRFAEVLLDFLRTTEPVDATAASLLPS